MTQTVWLIEMAWKGSVILIAAFTAAALLGRVSAASRHFLWTAAFAALLILPAAILVAPEWNAAPAVAAAPRDTTLIRIHAAAAPATPVSARSLTPWFLVWAAGCLFSGIQFVAGAWRARTMVRRGKRADFAESAAAEVFRSVGPRRRVPVIVSESARVPMACGAIRPVIVLPAAASEWPAGRLETVLRHEATHIMRKDAAAQVLAHAACCVYWFHPMAHLGERRLRQERERACDDAVLAAGTPAHEYADDLLALARGLAAGKNVNPAAPAMAEGSDLETRIQAMLDPMRNRRPLRARWIAGVAVAVIAVLASTASVTVHAQTAQGALAGVVEDPSGARVPGCHVVAKNQDGSNQETTLTNAAGEYLFNAIPPGKYALEFAARGFAIAKADATAAANASARVDAHLQLGATNETLTVAGRKPSTMASNTAPSSAPAPGQIRVGGRVEAAKLVFHVDPVYLAELQQAGVEGRVVIQAIISKEGMVTEARVTNTDVDPRLVKQAVDAVTQWRYQPSRLNGQPVTTSTTVTVEFTLN